jgi:hypothetical protein
MSDVEKLMYQAILGLERRVAFQCWNDPGPPREGCQCDGCRGFRALRELERIADKEKQG